MAKRNKIDPKAVEQVDPTAVVGDVRPAARSAVEEIGFGEPLDTSVSSDGPDQDGPHFVWVRFPADAAPHDGLDYVADVDGHALGRFASSLSRRPAAPRVVTRPTGAPIDPRLSPARASFNTEEEQLPARQAPPRKPTHPDYFDQHTSPLNKRRYLALAREKAFPAFKVGKQVLALRTDVDEYIASRAVMGRPSPPAPPPDEVDDVLARAGLQRKR